MGLKSWTVGQCGFSRRFGGLAGEWRMLVMSARSVIGDAGKDNERGLWLALLVAGGTAQMFSLCCEVPVAGGEGDGDEVGVSMTFDESEEVMLQLSKWSFCTVPMELALSDGSCQHLVSTLPMNFPGNERHLAFSDVYLIMLLLTL
jgi:hypothetical protein